MDPYRLITDTWNKVAAVYADRFGDLRIYDASYSSFCNRVNKEHAEILEIGCGPGNITRYLLDKNPRYHIDAIDVSVEMIGIARKNCPEANCFVMDARDIGQLQKKYDAIVCGFCIPYLMPPDFEKLISDAVSILYTSGSIYLSFVDGESSKSGYVKASTGDETYFNYYPHEVVKGMLLKCGFRQLETHNVSFDCIPGRKEQHTIIIATLEN